MAVKRKPFVYDAQTKRMLIQLMHVFSGYQVRTGIQRDGQRHFIDVPLIYGSQQKTVGYVIAGSENYLAHLPIMSLYMTGLSRKKEWVHSQQHYEAFQFWERARDPDGNLIVNAPGKRKIIERYMPAPYDMNFEVAIWASNNDQLYQLVEQLLIVFNPEMEIQLSNSPADWSFLTTLTFEGEVKFELAIPQGTEPDPLNVATLSFNTVLWISSPVKVYDAKVIQTVHVDFKQLEDDYDFDAMTSLDGLIVRPPEDAPPTPDTV